MSEKLSQSRDLPCAHTISDKKHTLQMLNLHKAT